MASVIPALPADGTARNHASSSTGQGSRWQELVAGILPTDRDHRTFLLLLRFLVINMAGFALLGAAALQGWLGLLYVRDTTGLVTLIIVVFGVGFVVCTQKILQMSRELNQLRALVPEPGSRIATYLREIDGREAGSRALLASALRARLSAKVAPIRHVANSLVLLGLIGTVVGFIIALSGVDPDSTADAAAISSMVQTLITGMAVALDTTLVGAVLNIWLSVNARLLEGGAVRLVTGIVERGELDA